jgi:hypothetical protein
MAHFITSKTAAGELVRIFGTNTNRTEARAEAARRGGTVRTEADVVKLATDGKLDVSTILPGYAALVSFMPAKTLSDIAKEIKATNRNRVTLGKKEKFTKRVITAPETITEATAFVKANMTEAKVRLVRIATAWESSTGAQLQRRDMFVVFHALNVEISDATISTQFQKIRSGTITLD